MVITREDAALALADIDRTEVRGGAARTYRKSGNILLLWGGVWVVAYTATGLLPVTQSWMPWVPGDLVGILGTIALCRDPAARKLPGTRVWLLGMAVAAFMAAIYVTHPPQNFREFAVLPPLMVAFLYVLLGAGRLSRFAWIGVGLFVATLFGFFALPSLFAYWLAVVGGGSLVAGGLWLRSA